MPHVVAGDHWWNPAVEDQATDRAHRIGQTHPVVVHRLMCVGALEERIDEILQSKRTLSESILDNEVSMQLSELDNASLASPHRRQPGIGGADTRGPVVTVPAPGTHPRLVRRLRSLIASV